MKTSIIKNIHAILLSLLVVISFVFGYHTEIHAAPTEESFWIEYIDVGQGDCALIQCNGHYMMIDGGPPSASSIVYTILKQKQIKNIDVMIATHPDADHIGGLSGALNYASVKTVYSPIAEHDTKTFNSLVKYVKKQGKTLTVPSVGDSFYIGSAKVQILGPAYHGSESNNDSIVTKITYGDNSFLFMGDAEAEEESDIIKGKISVDVDVLKVGHHGSNSSSSKAFLKKVNPSYSIISVGADNSYGHPTSGTIEQLTNIGSKIYRTDLQGDIICKSDGKSLTFETEKVAANKDIIAGADDRVTTGTNVGAAADVKTEEAAGTKTGVATGANGYSPCGSCKSAVASSTTSNQNEITNNQSEADNSNAGTGTIYILNTNSKKFHYANCSSVSKMSEKNKKQSNDSRDKIIEMGYSPCGNCHP